MIPYEEYLSGDIVYHTRCHTPYTLGTHRVPTHTNTRKHRHTQTAPRRTRARYDADLGNGELAQLLTLEIEAPYPAGKW